MELRHATARALEHRAHPPLLRGVCCGRAGSACYCECSGRCGCQPWLCGAASCRIIADADGPGVCLQRDTMQLSEAEQAQLSVTRATTTPLWKGLLTMIKYRTTRNYRNPEFLGPRIGDKFVFSILVATLYLGVGSDLVNTNYLNIAAVLFMWSTLPACAPSARDPCRVCLHARTCVSWALCLDPGERIRCACCSVHARETPPQHACAGCSAAERAPSACMGRGR